jgi:hypothetical protein
MRFSEMGRITVNQRDDTDMKNVLKAEIQKIRDSMEFYERLVLFKSNGHHNLSNAVYEPIVRQSRESFVDYVLRVREAFPPDHTLPRLRLRKTTWDGKPNK